MADKVRVIMKRLGMKDQGELAKLVDVTQATVSRWLAGSEPKGPSRDKLNKLYEDATSGAAVTTAALVPLMGYVGAGAEIDPDFEQVPEGGLELVEVEIPVPDGMVCFIVRGDSMFPQYRDGHTLIAWAEQHRPLEAYYGREAVVRTSDGRRFIKTIERGADRSTVTLTSWNRPPIENQRLEWIGEIYAALPPRFLRR